MKIKREGEPTFIPVVLTLESDSELQALIMAIDHGFDNSPNDSREELVLRTLRDQLHEL